MRTPGLFSLIAAIALQTGAACAADQPNGKVSVLTGEQVIQILDETVDWYRTLGTQQQYATQPSDLLILFANRQTADQVIDLAFGIARANAELLSSEADTAQKNTAAGRASSNSLERRQEELDARQKRITQEMAEVRKQSGAAAKGKQARLAKLQDDLDATKARMNLLDTRTEFVSSSDSNSADANALKAQIDAIAATVPGATSAANSATASATPPAGQGATTAAVTANAAKQAPMGSGLWELAGDVLRHRNKIASIDLVDQHTAALALTFKNIIGPPLKRLKEYSARSDELDAQADKADGDELKGLRSQIDTLAWLFKQTSEILNPLHQERVLLRQYRHNLANWHDAAQRQYHDSLRALAIRAAFIAAILAAVFALAEVWKRTVLRYVLEPRRRHKFLLIRSILLWPIVIGIVGVSFITEISSFATFAGLLTAGLAVAMQSLLASVVGYFLLIGKYGIRVGDRIQIGAVVGEVVDLGLVRMHLMELNQQGPLGPTGRVVAFPNLVVFQASGGLFKQVPAGDVSWRETTLTLPVIADYSALKENLLSAMRSIVAEYGDADQPAPQVQMRLVNGRMEALLRYPIHQGKAPEIEERVSQAVLKVIAATG
jgi:small-conductance mechanosensitive channel